MGVLFTDQFSDYPAYFVEITLTDGPGGPVDSVVAFWICSFSGTAESEGDNTYPIDLGIGPTGNQDYTLASMTGSDPVVPSLLSAIQSWAESYEWSSPNVYSSIAVTEYSETATNVTPS